MSLNARCLQVVRAWSLMAHPASELVTLILVLKCDSTIYFSSTHTCPVLTTGKPALTHFPLDFYSSLFPNLGIVSVQANIFDIFLNTGRQYYAKLMFSPYDIHTWQWCSVTHYVLKCLARLSNIACTKLLTALPMLMNCGKCIFLFLSFTFHFAFSALTLLHWYCWYIIWSGIQPMKNLLKTCDVQKTNAASQPCKWPLKCRTCWGFCYFFLFAFRDMIMILVVAEQHRYIVIVIQW